MIIGHASPGRLASILVTWPASTTMAVAHTRATYHLSRLDISLSLARVSKSGNPSKRRTPVCPGCAVVHHHRLAYPHVTPGVRLVFMNSPPRRLEWETSRARMNEAFAFWQDLLRGSMVGSGSGKTVAFQPATSPKASQAKQPSQSMRMRTT